MPWRLIGFILILAIVTTFIGFNLGNGSDISFGFVTVRQVPVYLTIFASFAVGMIAALPVAFGRASRRRKEGRVPGAGRASRSQVAGGHGGRSTSPETELDDEAYGVD